MDWEWVKESKSCRTQFTSNAHGGACKWRQERCDLNGPVWLRGLGSGTIRGEDKIKMVNTESHVPQETGKSEEWWMRKLQNHLILICSWDT